MSFVQMNMIEEAFTPTDKTDIVTPPSWTWADIKDLLSAEWEIGGSAMPAAAVVGLVVGE